MQGTAPLTLAAPHAAGPHKVGDVSGVGAGAPAAALPPLCQRLSGPHAARMGRHHPAVPVQVTAGILLWHARSESAVSVVLRAWLLYMYIVQQLPCC